MEKCARVRQKIAMMANPTLMILAMPAPVVLIPREHVAMAMSVRPAICIILAANALAGR